MGWRLTGWRALDWGERWRLLACVLLLPPIHAALSLAGYRRTRRWIETLTCSRQPHPATQAELEAARTLARLAAIAGRRGVVDATCLRQSLLVHGWLRRRGLQPQLLLGMKPEPGPLQAHAWVELEGRRLLPGDAAHRKFLHPHTAP